LSELVEDDDSDAASVVVGTSSSTGGVILPVNDDDDWEHCERTVRSHCPPSPATDTSLQSINQSTRSHPEMVGDMSRVTLNFDLSKISFVRF